MSRGYWLAIAGDKSLAESESPDGWWCLPYEAKKGDIVLFYCSRAASATLQGIFAEAEVVTPPNESSKKNYYCSGYGFIKKGVYGYTELKIKRRFKTKLTAQMMKADPVLRSAVFVRRNFQGTTFSTTESIYQRIEKISCELQT